MCYVIAPRPSYTLYLFLENPREYSVAVWWFWYTNYVHVFSPLSTCLNGYSLLQSLTPTITYNSPRQYDINQIVCPCWLYFGFFIAPEFSICTQKKKHQPNCFISSQIAWFSRHNVSKTLFFLTYRSILFATSLKIRHQMFWLVTFQNLMISLSPIQRQSPWKQGTVSMTIRRRRTTRTRTRLSLQKMYQFPYAKSPEA